MRPSRLTAYGLLVPVACAYGLWLTSAFSENADAATELNNQAIQQGKAGNVEQAVGLLREAAELSPGDPLIRTNLSMALSDLGQRHAKEGRTEEALRLLKEAVGLHPENGSALALMGDLHYLEKNDFVQAIQSWKQAHRFLPAAQGRILSDRIAQAQRDQAVERRFLAAKTIHFQIRYPSPEDHEKALRVGQILEQAYARISAELDSYPTSITAIVYGGPEFQQVNARRDWALGFYDGRIRIRLEEIGTEREAWVLPHELAHAFLQETYGHRLPIWVHEGYAQVHESPRELSSREQAVAQGVALGRNWIPLKWIDSRFEQPTSDEDILRCYGESRRVVEHLISKHGSERFKEFLKRISSGEPVDRAFDQSFAPERWSRVDQGILE